MEEVTNLLHRCGACLNTFTSEVEYLAHKCAQTGVTPLEPKHGMGANYLELQAAALQRGATAARESGDEETAQSTEAHLSEVQAVEMQPKFIKDENSQVAAEATDTKQ